MRQARFFINDRLPCTRQLHQTSSSASTSFQPVSSSSSSPPSSIENSGSRCSSSCRFSIFVGDRNWSLVSTLSIFYCHNDEAATVQFAFLCLLPCRRCRRHWSGVGCRTRAMAQKAHLRRRRAADPPNAGDSNHLSSNQCTQSTNREAQWSSGGIWSLSIGQGDHCQHHIRRPTRRFGRWRTKIIPSWYHFSTFINQPPFGAFPL